MILRHGRRRLIAFGVTAQPLAEWIARQNTEAFPWDGAPKYLIRDRPIAPRSPWQNGHVERLIGSLRRASLDHVLVLGEERLRRVRSA